MEQTAHNRKHLGEIRRSRALTQRRLAALAGISPNTVTALEGGKHQPSATTLGSLASALGLTSEEVWAACEESQRRARDTAGDVQKANEAASHDR